MRFLCLILVLILTATAGLPLICTAAPTSSGEKSPEQEKQFALSLYGGRFTDDNWRKSLMGRASFVNSSLYTVAGHWTFLQAASRRWSFELEGNVTKHAGDQQHWEFNAPILTGRWHAFPWSRVVDTSAAFGAGFSYATEVPDVEKELSASSEKLLLYWHLDATIGPPKANWALLFRLHHRSSGYGLMADHGGSNVLATGIRFFF